jgi:serine/threonine protein kinase
MYRDAFACDLSLALSSDVVPRKSFPFIIASLFSGLDACHARGLMHRFVNPSSVYVTVQGQPKLADFRYAKTLDGSRSFTICGDPLFFSPEIVSQRGYCHGTDLWALGVLAYEMYEGHTPFGSEDGVDVDETEVFRRIASPSAAASLRWSGEATPQAARSLIRELLDPEEGNRPGFGKAVSSNFASFVK